MLGAPNIEVNVTNLFLSDEFFRDTARRPRPHPRHKWCFIPTMIWLRGDTLILSSP